MLDTRFLRASDGTGPAPIARINTARIAGATVFKVDTVVKWPVGAFIATVGTLNVNGYIDPTLAPVNEFRGHVTSGDIILDSWEPGFPFATVDLGNAVNQYVILKQTTGWSNLVQDALAEIQNTFIGPYSNRNLYDNAIVNSGCSVSQRAAPNLSTAYQYGAVDRFAGKATGTAVSAGTISQSTSPLAVQEGFALKFAGVTITGAGIVFARYRMEAKDAVLLKGKALSFRCRVYHDVGTSVNYNIYLNKPTVADNFASVTAIANSGNQAVATATATEIKFENIAAGNIGDISNGLEIEIQVACGAVTLKNFEFSQFLLNLGAVRGTYGPRDYQSELAGCQRYYQVVRQTTQGYSGFATGFVGSGSFQVATPVTMRALPTITSSGLLHRFGGADYSITSTTPEVITSTGISIQTTTSGAPANGNASVVATSPGGFMYMDSEL